MSREGGQGFSELHSAQWDRGQSDSTGGSPLLRSPPGVALQCGSRVGAEAPQPGTPKEALMAMPGLGRQDIMRKLSRVRDEGTLETKQHQLHILQIKKLGL